MKIDKSQIETLVKILDSHRFDPEFHQSEYKALLMLKHLNSLMQKGWVFVPSELTAENGAKSALIGEFKETEFISCEYCDPKEECEVCGSTGQHKREIVVSWDNIKSIYAKAVQHFLEPWKNNQPNSQ